METFIAQSGTRFLYHEDLHDEILIQVSGVHPEMPESFARVRSVETGLTIATIGVPAEDFMEFAEYLAERRKK